MRYLALISLLIISSKVYAKTNNFSAYILENDTNEITTEEIHFIIPEDDNLINPGNKGLLFNRRNKSLFGKFERKKVTKAYSGYKKQVGLVGDDCTGTLIGPKHVLTAAHCLWSPWTGKWEVKNLSFTPGITDSNDNLKSYDWDKVIVPERFTKNAFNANYDYAVIILKEEVGKIVGWRAFQAIQFSKIVADMPKYLRPRITITGYPSDKEESTMWTVSCPLKGDNKTKLYYKCDTYSGMSGSAVTKLTDNSIIGIHTNGGNVNSGVRINKEVFSILLNILNL